MNGLTLFLPPSRGAYRALLASAAATAILVPAARADYQSEILSENPIAYYRFSDGVNSVDPPPSPAINSGSLGAAANGSYQLAFTRGVAGAIAGNTAVAFVDNTTPTSIDYTGGITIPNNAALNPSQTGTNPFTVECWVLPSRDTSTLLSPVNSMSFTTGRAGYLIYQNSATWEIRIGNKTGATVVTSLDGGTVTPGQWQHLALTYSGGTNGTMTLYVNGVQAVSGAVTNGYEANDNAPLVIGATSAPNRTFDGSVDEVAFFNTALSASRIQARFNQRTSNPAGYAAHVQADSPLAYWRLDEAAYTLRTPPVADNLGSLGNTADGSYSSQAQDTTDGPSPASGFGGFGANNPCLSLADANAWVTSNQQLLNNRAAFTVMGWVKRGATQSTRGGYFGQNDLLEFGDAGNGTQIEAWSSASGQILTDSPYPFADDQWGFITYVADGSNVQLYINGTLAKTVASSVANYGSSAFNFNIGGGGIFNASGDFFRGKIDEVAIFDHAVTPGRVQQLYAAALSNTGPGLVETTPKVTPSAFVSEGDPYTLSIDVTGSPPFTYQWSKDGSPIPGATGATYTVNSAVLNTSPFVPYQYTVVVTNGSGNVSSDPTDVFVSPVLRWTGTAAVNPGKWDINGSQNWKPLAGNTPTNYTDDFGVLFDDTAGTKTVAVQQDVTPQSVKFNNNTDYTVTGDQWTIGGATGAIFTKAGSGVLELGNFSVFVDDLVLSAGTLRVGNGTSGALSQITKVNATGGLLQINQGAGTVYDAPTKLAAAASLSVTGTGDLSVTGAITPASLSTGSTETFNRNGTTVVNTTNSAGKTIAINGGRVAFDGNQNSNRTAANAAISVATGGIMEVRGVNAIPGGPINSDDITLNGGVLEVSSGGSAAIPGGQSHAHIRNLTLNQGQVVLSYSGSGSAYNGESFQLNGDLTVGGTGTSTISLGGGADAGNSGISLLATKTVPTTAPAVHVFNVPDVVTGPTADLIISAELEPTDAAAAETVASSINKTGAGTLRLANGIAHSYTGTLQVSQGTLEGTGSLAGPLVIQSGALLRPGASASADTFTVAGATLGGTYQCEINGAAADKLQVNGNLTLQAGAQIAFSTLAGGVTAPSYTIAACSGGTISGPLPSVTGLPATYSLSIVSNTSLVLAKTGTSFGVTITPTPLPPGGVETFSSGGGGFSQATSVSAEADWVYTGSSWRSNGQASQGGVDNTTYLGSAVYSITQNGPIILTFSHRYSFEPDFWDGGAVEVSFNGGAFTRVPGSSFTTNGYNGAVRADSDTVLKGSEAFVQDSTGHPNFITSTCSLGNGTIGSQLQVRFICATDANTSGNLSPQGWEIDSVQVSNAVPNLRTLTWPAGTLQYSDTLLPPWTDLPTATSPLVIDPEVAPKRFYRVKP